MVLGLLFGADARAQGVPEEVELLGLDRAIERREARYQLALDQGEELFEAGDVEGALASFERARALRDRAVASFALGQCLRALGRPADSIAAFERAIARGLDRPERAHLAIRRARQEQLDQLEDALGLEVASPAAAPSLQMCQDSGLAPESIRQVVRLHGNELRGAYERARQREPELRGRLVVRFLLSPAGEVGRVTVEPDTIDDQELMAEVSEVFRGLRFPSRTCGDDLAIVYPLSFRHHRRRGPIEPPPEERSSLLVDGALSSAVVRRTLRQRTAELRRAWTSHNEETRLVVRFNIDERGQVYASLVRSMPADGELAASIRAVIEATQFPAAEADTTVVFPMELAEPEGEVARLVTP